MPSYGVSPSTFARVSLAPCGVWLGLVNISDMTRGWAWRWRRQVACPTTPLPTTTTHLLDEELAERAVRVVGHREVERAVAVRILVVDVGPSGQHQLHEFPVAVLGANEQQCVALVVLAVHREVGVERVLEPAQPRVARLRMRSSEKVRLDRAWA